MDFTADKWILLRVQACFTFTFFFLGSMFEGIAILEYIYDCFITALDIMKEYVLLDSWSYVICVWKVLTYLNCKKGWEITD